MKEAQAPGTPRRHTPFLGELLVCEGAISAAQLEAAIESQKLQKVYKPLGQILIDQEAITAKQLNFFLDLYQKRPRLGEILVRTGVLTREQLESVLLEQKEKKVRLGELLLRHHFVPEEKIREAICVQYNIPFVDLDTAQFDRGLVRLVKKSYAKQHMVVPVARVGDTLTVAMNDPTNRMVAEELKAVTGCSVTIVTSTSAKITRALGILYDDEEALTAAPADNESQMEVISDDEGGKSKYASDTTEVRKAEEIVRRLVGMAVDRRASDIHIEPVERGPNIRFRIDGVLVQIALGPLEAALKQNQKEIVSRIKILSKLDISEKRRPQDGSFRVKLEREGKTVAVDFRVSIIPGYFGESVVLRILDPRNAPKGIDHLGFSPRMTTKYKDCLRRTTGIFLVTGPTGSGKTTTLYAGLMSLYRPEIRMLTAEDPIEYVYDQFSQSEVNDAIGNTFSKYLRAFLRHDPEVMLVGEVRDGETAEIAFRGAQTGHFLLSSMHTNDAVSAVTRLRDLGIEANLITGSLVGVLSQRLVRKVCKSCREEYTPPDELMAEFFPEKVPSFTWYKGTGCSECNLSGYKGRMPVAELWSPSEKDIILINKDAPFDEIKASAAKTTITMADEAMEKLRQGVTNLEELIRVLPYSNVELFRKIDVDAPAT